MLGRGNLLFLCISRVLSGVMISNYDKLWSFGIGSYNIRYSVRAAVIPHETSSSL